MDTPYTLYRALSRLTILVLFFWSAGAYSQNLSLTSGLNATQLTDVLVGSGSGVTATAIGSSGTVARFSLPSNATLGLQDGVFLTTGNLTDPIGPKNASSSPGTQRGGSGDADLSNIINVNTYDASTLTFSFVATGTKISFRYVFASDEYDEYVCSIVNDGFALLLKEQSASEWINIAKTQNGDYVSINTVNSGGVGIYGNAGNCSLSGATRSEQYEMNSGHSGDAVAFDGYTKVLTASYDNLIPCSTYVLKVVIADAFDGKNDSGLFLEAGSFKTDLPQINLLETSGSSFCAGSTVTLSTLSGMQNYQWYKGSTLIEECPACSTKTVSEAGDYKVTVKPLSCSSNTLTSEIIHLTEEAQPSTALTYSQTSLCAANPLPVSVSTTTGASYLWSNGATTAALSVTEPGDYSVTVTKGACSLTSEVVHVTGNTVSSGLVASDISCNGLSDGGISLSPSGGKAPYKANWDHIPGNDDGLDALTGLAADDYHVVITDADGCVKEETVTIQDPAALNPAMAITETGTGKLSVNNVSGGTSPYTYVWKNAADQVVGTEVEATDLPAGDYTLTVTDARGCTKVLNHTLIGGCTLAEVSGDREVVHVTCPPTGEEVLTNGSISIHLTGAAGDVTYAWTKNGATFSSDEDLSDLGIGHYVLNAIDEEGCEVNDLHIEIIQPVLNVSASGDQPFCHGAINGALHGSASGTDGYNQSASLLYFWTNSAEQLVATTADVMSSSSTPIPADTYTFKVFYNFPDETQCVAETTVVVGEPAGLTYTLDAQDISCHGADDGQLTLTVTGGTAPFTATWTSDDPAYVAPAATMTSNPQVQTGLKPASYTVEVTDSKGCNSTITSGTSVVSLSQPSAPLEITSLTQGTTRGTVDLTVAGGTEPYTYAWSNGATIPEPNNLQENVEYTLTVTDANGCTDQASITLTTNGCHLAAQVEETTGTTCYGGTDGSITVNITSGSGSGSYTYTWTVPAGQTVPTVEDPTGLKAGNYNLVITDTEDGCQSNLTAVVTQPNQITVSKTEVDVACHDQSNGSVTITATSGGAGGYTYAWTGPSSFTASTQDISSLAAGSYTLTVTDSKSCTQDFPVTIENPEVLSINFTATDVTCNGLNNGTLQSNPAGGWSPYTYAWTGPSAFSATTEDLTTLVPGTYYLTLTDARSCTTSASHVIAEPAVLAVSQSSGSPVDVTCHGGENGSIAVDVSGGTAGYTYSWKLFSTQVSTSEDPSSLKAGTYALTVTDSKSCTATLNVTVAEPPAPPVESDRYPWICESSTNLVLTTTSGKTAYQWYKLTTGGARSALSGQTANTLSLSAATGSAGDYVVEVTNGSCVEYSDKFKVAIDPVPVAQINVTPDRLHFCEGQTVTLTSDRLASDYYEWQLGGSPLTPTTRSIEVTTGGEYTLIVHNRQCNSEPDEKTITFHEPFTASITTQSNVSCPDYTDGSATVAVDSSPTPTGTVTYSWTNAANASVGTNSTSLSGVAAGTYHVRLTDEAGCEATANVTLTEPSFTVTPSITNVTCHGGSNGAISLSISTPSFGSCTSLTWKNAEGTTIQTGAGTSKSGLTAGNYTVEFTCGSCTVTRTYTVAEPAELAVALNTSQPLCNGQTGSITATPSGGTSPYTYLWSNSSTSATAGSLSAGSYTVTVTDAASCSLTTAPVTIAMPSAVAAVISEFQNPSCSQHQDGSMKVTASGGTPGYTYSWSSGQTTASLSNLGVNTYTVTVKDANLCETTASKTLSAGACANEMVLVLEATPTSCPGRDDGKITIRLTGGTPPYTYDWSHLGGDDNGPSPGLLAPGSYTLKVYDASLPKHLVVNETATVTEGTGVCPRECHLLAVPTVVDANCNGTATGSVSLSISNGEEPYRVDWDHITGTDDEQNLSSLTAGYYKAWVHDAQGCTYRVEPLVKEPVAAKIFASQLQVCPDKTVVLSSTSATGNLWSTSATTRDITVGPGTYTLTVGSVSCTNSTTTITIAEKTDCTPKSAVCDPEPFPTYPVTDNCVQEQQSLALVNAQYLYNEYLNNVRAEFRHRYIQKCLSSQEEFGMQYTDKEHHYTLYYYDQGGNLVRTVPPEGVILTTNAQSLDSIRQDRASGTRRVYTKHRYATTYTYNSLGQLTAQNMPDHNTMNLESQQNIQGSGTSGLPSGLTITSTQFTDGGNGVLTAYDNSGKGYLFTTSDGGKQWSALSRIGTMNLRDIEVENVGATSDVVAYVIGDDGVFLKSEDNGLNWTLVPTGVDADFIAMDFEDDQHGVAFDKLGRRYETTDGAESWTLYSSVGTTLQSIVSSIGTLTGIDFYVHDHVYATLKNSEQGFVMHSSDRGETWTSMENIRTEPLAAVQLLNGSFAVGITSKGTLTTSDDGGISWTIRPGYVPAGNVSQMFFRSLTQGVVLSGGKIYYTNNAGSSWAVPASLAAESGSILRMEIRKGDNDLEGYAFTATKLYRTIDGGFTWTPMTVQVPEGAGKAPLVSFSAVASVNDGTRSADLRNSMLVAGKTASNTGDPVIYQYRPSPALTEQAWTPLKTTDLPSGYTISAMHLSSDGDHAVLKLGSGEIYYTSNLSALTGLPKVSDTEWETDETYPASTMEFESDAVGYILNSSGLYRTANTGQSWSSVTTAFSGSVSASSFIEGKALVAQDGGASGGSLYMGSDLDATPSWFETGSFCVAPPLEAVSVEPSSGDIVVVGAKGTVLNQVSGSVLKMEETLQNASAYSNLLSVAAAGGNIVAAGENGTVLYNTGSGWGVKTVSGNPKLQAVAYDAGGNVYAAGNGVIAASAVTNIANMAPVGGVATSTTVLTLEFDKGLSLAAGMNGKILIPDAANSPAWKCVTDKEPEPLYGSDMATASVGYSVGKEGTVLKTTDGGKTWQDINSVTDKMLTAVSFITADIGIVVGQNGVLKRTKNGGVDKFSDPVSISASGVTFSDVQMVTEKYAVAIGNNGTAGVAYESFDNGKTWTARTFSPAAPPLRAVDFADESYGMAVGDDGAVYRIYPVALNDYDWTLDADGTIGSTDLLSVDCVDRELIYAGGPSGALFKTVNGGASWTAETNTAATGDLLSINFTTRTNGFLAGTGSSLGLLVDEKDMYSGKFWYDQLGRLVLSQNAKQFNNPEGADRPYSYTLYDELGRIAEVGELLTDEVISDYTTPGNSGQIVQDRLNAFHGLASSKRQVTKTYYDEQQFSDGDYPFYQENLRNRVAKVSYSAGGTDEDHASYFSYDIHGNVKTLVQDYAKMASEHEALADFRYKKMRYEYDLVSGNVNKVAYQEGKPDQFYHVYEYDADNRITHVSTSRDGVLWDRDAKYFYYDHGPLARTELGDQKVQAMDYAYTIQGWIKGVNSESLNALYDIGKDGNEGMNQYVGSDSYGYSLSYFDGDYEAIGGTSANGFMASITSGFGGALDEDTKDLYNGNISRMVTSITNAENELWKRETSPRMASYKYDQLNRIRQVRSYMNNFDQSTNEWTSGYNPSFAEWFEYDANGNITHLERTTYGTSTAPAIDYLTYHYEKVGEHSSYKKYTNKLRWVDDEVSNDEASSTDIDDQEFNNYEYDEIGNLIHDEKEGIEEIRWNVSGKVTEVIRAEDSDKPDLEFLYDAMGNRIAKIVKPAGTKTDATTWTTTWYTRDASGNVMSTYEYKNPLEEDSYVLKEQMLYGSSRLGICEVNLDLLAESETLLSERVLGRKRYEESNHLGNVLTVVSDLRLPYDAEGQNLVENGTFNDQYYNYMGLHWEWLPGFDGDAYIKVGDGFNGNAQHIENTATHTKVILRNVFSTIESGKTYRISFKYRSNVNFIATGTTALTNGFIQSIPSNTGDALSYSYERVANGNEGGIYFFLNQTSTGYWFEIDDVSITLLDPDAEIDGYRAHIVSVNDYYAFGGNIQERSYYSPQYRYGFNGKENDGETGWQDYGMRMYNPVLGRFFRIDPLTKDYAQLTPYQFSSNSPISGIDRDGLEYYYAADGRFIGNVGESKDVFILKVKDAKTLQYDVERIDKLQKDFEKIGLTLGYKLDVKHDELMRIAATAYGESSVGLKVEVKEEVYAIANAQVNFKRITGKNVLAYAETDGNDMYNKFVNTPEKDRNGTFMQEAVFGAINATMGGKDYSNGATHWAGNDIGSDKEKWAETLKFTDPKHDLQNLGDNVLEKAVTTYWKNKKGENTSVRGSYTHVWESTAAYSGTNSEGRKSGTTFLKVGEDFKKATGSKGQ